MRILFEQGTPVPLRSEFPEHEIETEFERNWSELENGELLAAAENEEFDVFVTTDNNLQYQQNLSERTITIAVLSTRSWPRIRRAASMVRERIESATPGSSITIQIP